VLTSSVRGWPRERLAEWLSASSYGTVLVLSALTILDADDVASGLGWELITGVGLATWLAHLYADVIGDHVRHGARLRRSEIARAMRDGSPILIAAVPPALVLLLGRLDVLGHRLALWGSITVAVLQLVGVGAFVGATVAPRGASAWAYPAATAATGVAVVTLQLVLGH
jgi:hypothetical protein